ncbi:hypothetical protein IW261DRAFT_1503370 [Armillaria novae-zelandiae]|uniref:Uncharacterized protein n=1 Tax=Armillaria novae-zelandiae TaxID=153914 RepID=A0AA39U918_9AGAR|nr:hypothetical protein IW261DRAFT_1503370 [Armillaria novae-zelandiae]
MAIISGIRKQRTGSAGAESNANPKGLDKWSTEPDHSPNSRQQTTTTMPASTSEHKPFPELYEPDDQWKAELKEKLSVAFSDMLLQAKQKLKADLTMLDGDGIDPAKRKKSIDEYQASERQIKSFAAQSFRVEVEKEREQRRWAAGLEIRTERRADLGNEQMAIMSGIRKQRTASAGAESNANPKGLDKWSTEPDHLPNSRQQTTTTMPASTSEHEPFLELYEPDDQWKAELKEKLSVAFCYGYPPSNH